MEGRTLRARSGSVCAQPSNQLLVISEDGELVLLSATPDRHIELANFQGVRREDLEPSGVGG